MSDAALADWQVRVAAPAWLRLAGLTRQAELLEQLAPLTDSTDSTDFERAKLALDQVCARAAETAAAAQDAALAAVWAASRDAASAAVSAAVRTAASAAAQNVVAAVMAAMYTARDAVWAAAADDDTLIVGVSTAAAAAARDAAWATAWAAAWAAVRADVWPAAQAAAAAASGAASGVVQAAAAAASSAAAAAAQAAAWARIAPTAEQVRATARELAERLGAEEVQTYLARYARVHSPADVLRERVRVGDLRADRLELAARLAHPVAREVHPHVQLVDWTSWSERREVLRPLMESDRGLVISWLADGAERALGHAERVLPIYESCHLPIYESRHPDDSRPRRAIEAGRDLCAVLRRWVRGEATDGDVREARHAAYYAALGAAASAVGDAYDAAYAACYAADAAYYAADAAYYAADAADYAASADVVAYAAYAAADAYAFAYDAAYDADAYAAAADAERAWRRDRLALYLLGEVEEEVQA